jgi:hypothetical protein
MGLAPMFDFEGIKISSFVPGRLRLRVERVKRDKDFAQAVEERLGAIDGIKQVDINGLTGSVLVSYDPAKLARPESLEALTAAAKELFPTFDASLLARWLG